MNSSVVRKSECIVLIYASLNLSTACHGALRIFRRWLQTRMIIQLNVERFNLFDVWNSCKHERAKWKRIGFLGGAGIWIARLIAFPWCRHGRSSHRRTAWQRCARCHTSYVQKEKWRQCVSRCHRSISWIEEIWSDDRTQHKLISNQSELGEIRGEGRGCFSFSLLSATKLSFESVKCTSVAFISSVVITIWLSQ